jgi:hypothetical protein
MNIFAWEIFRYVHKFRAQAHSAKGALSLAALTIVLFSTALPAFANSPPNPNLPRTYYVSKNGDNTDGLSWKTAWNEMDQIHWSELSPQRHDSLVIDGGERRMVYQKPLIFQIQPFYYALPVSVSSEDGHSGQAIIAPGNTVNGIEINSGGIQLNGSRRSGLRVYGAKSGVRINSSGPYPFSVKNIEASHCTEAGLNVNNAYYPVSVSQMILHDNATNVLVQHGGGYPGVASLTKCWIYNSNYSVDSDGVRVDGPLAGPPMQAAVLNNCVIGPGLRDGFSNSTSSRPTLTNCLFINATRKNVSSYSISLQNCTSFMTRLNPSGSAHSALKLQGTGLPYGTPGTLVNNSIVYGGMVEVPLTISLPYPPYSVPFPISVSGNTQFQTTGNTTVLSPTMVNPLFVSPVGLLPNVTPIPILMALDFSLRPSSPAQGTGSSVTSIHNLLKSFD